MRALGASRTSLVPGGVLAGPWVRDPLWRNARAVPSLDLRFADNKSLVDAVTGASLVTHTRASSKTVTNSAGVLETVGIDVPAFDHNPITGESLGLLVEEQRTNLCLQSEDFSTTWAVSQATVTANSIASPTGATTADALFETSATSEHRIRQNFAGLTANTNYTISVYIKDLGGRNLSIRALDTDNPTNGYLAIFSPLSGTVVTAATSIGSGVAASASITALIGGWYRVALTGNAGAACTKYILDFFSLSGTTSSFAGDTGKGLYLWGAQLEAGAFPTSYIPTTTAAVTRSADVASITGSAFSSWYRQDEGTVFADVFRTYSGNFPGFPGIYSLNDGTNSNVILLYGAQGSQAVTNNSVTSGGVAQTTYEQILTNVPGPNRIAQALAVNSSMLAGNGTLTTQDNSVTMPVGINRVVIGQNWGGHIRRLTFWPQRLSNASLQAITQ